MKKSDKRIREESKHVIKNWQTQINKDFLFVSKQYIQTTQQFFLCYTSFTLAAFQKLNSCKSKNSIPQSDQCKTGLTQEEMLYCFYPTYTHLSDYFASLAGILCRPCNYFKTFNRQEVIKTDSYAPWNVSHTHLQNSV